MSKCLALLLNRDVVVAKTIKNQNFEVKSRNDFVCYVTNFSLEVVAYTANYTQFLIQLDV